MKLETFFDKFDELADAPDAVAKMRDLVLELAVRGRLVVQAVTDEPVSLLLKRVLAEKNRRSGRVERLEQEQGASQGDKAFEIPASWKWIGATTPAVMVSDQGKKVQTKDILEAGKYPVVDQGRMFIRGYCDDAERVLNVAEPIVLFGDHTRETKFIDFDFVVGADGVKLLQPICIDPRFYFLVLRWLPLESRGYARHFKLLKAAMIPLPPLAEQKRIVAKVDELMALCDRLEAQQQERETRYAALARASLARFADAPDPANLPFLFHPSYSVPPADFRKSILTLAIQGNLVPQDPNDEPAEELFARIEGTKEQLIKQRTIRRAAVEPNPSGDASEPLPPGWLWTRLGNSFDVRDGTHDTPKYTTEGFPLVTSKNIYSGRLLFDGANLISEEDHRQICERSRVDRGDILFAMIGSIGNPVIVNTDREFSIKNVALFKYYAAADSEPRFLLLYLKLVAEEMRAKAAGGVQSFVSLGFLRNYQFPLPPLAEQRRIVAKVDQLMVLVDQLETQLAVARTTGADLMEAVVSELTARA